MFRIALTLVVVGLGAYALNISLFLLNQPSTLAAIGGVALLPILAGSTIWAAKRIWK